MVVKHGQVLILFMAGVKGDWLLRPHADHLNLRCRSLKHGDLTIFGMGIFLVVAAHFGSSRFIPTILHGWDMLLSKGQHIHDLGNLLLDEVEQGAGVGLGICGALFIFDDEDDAIDPMAGISISYFVTWWHLVPAVLTQFSGENLGCRMHVM